MTEPQSDGTGQTSEELYEQAAFGRAVVHTDETPLTINADNKAVFTRSVTEAFQAAAFVREFMDKDTLTVSSAANGMSVALHALMRAAQAVGHDAVLNADHEQTLTILRAANVRIRELEQQLANSVDKVAFAMYAGKVCDHVFTRWRRAGFGYGKAQITRRMLQMELSCSIDRGRGLHSDTPVSDAERAAARLRQLVADGLEVVHESRGSHDAYVLDTEANRRLMAGMIEQLWPGAKLSSWTNAVAKYGDNTRFYLREVKVNVDLTVLDPEEPELTADEC